VVSGGAKGVDEIGEWLATAFLGLPPATVFRADWYNYGKFAGIKRNREMAEYAQALVAVWDGKSPGTANMIMEATERGLKVYVHRV
jgi:hypothetical protein